MKQKAIVILSIFGIALLCNFYLKDTSTDIETPKNVVDKTVSKAEEIKSFLKKRNTVYNDQSFLTPILTLSILFITLILLIFTYNKICIFAMV